jgi:hypothetical protein
VDLGEIAGRLGVPVEDVDRVRRLAGDRPSAPLPAKTDAPAILDRLAVRPDDAAEIMAGWPYPRSPLWTPELRWLLDRSIALVRADLGVTAGCRPVLSYRVNAASPGGICMGTRTWPWSASSRGITATTASPVPCRG